MEPGGKTESPALKTVIHKIKGSPPDLAPLKDELEAVSKKYGLQAAYNLLLRTEVILGMRKPSLAIYDHTFHIIGGGQKYGLTAAHALQDYFDITIIANREISHRDIREWYHLDLSGCPIKIIEIPFFEEAGSHHIDPAKVSRRMENPFHLVSKESGNYDFFINNSMNEMVYPLADISAVICHFPERRPKSYFYADRYSYIIYNSQYTARWIEKKWQFSPHRHIYPPVDMEPGKESGGDVPLQRENLILSVARFEAGGSKKQMEMIQAFLRLQRRFPGLLKDWKLVLAGGSTDENPYLEKIRDFLHRHSLEKIQLKINIPGDELKSLYRRAKIFWHLCGLDQTDPALVEHFGMTIAEAMQNRVVPIVFDGGGQREIVEPGISGFRFNSIPQLLNHTAALMKDSALLEEIGAGAFRRSRLFCRETFEKKIKQFFSELLKNYMQI